MEPTTNVQLSAGQKRTVLMGISFATGLTLGVVAVITIQNFGPLNNQATYDIAQNEVQQYSTQNGRSDAITNTLEIGQFQEIFSHRSISTQYEVLHSTLSRATEQELQDWWIQSQNIERENHRKIAQSAILQNLTTLNPQEALRNIEDVSKIHAEVLLKSVFSQWSISQLDGAIEAANTLSGTDRNIALQAILETRHDLPESKLQSIAKQLGREEHFLKLLSDAEAFNTLDKPEKAWDVLLNDEVDDSLQLESLAVIAKAWQEHVGFEVISNIYSDIQDFGSQVQLVKAIAQVDPAGALEYTSGLVAEYDKLNLSSIIVREWAKTDAKAALTTVSTFEPSSFSTLLEKDIASIWARTLPNEVIDSIETIPEQFRLSTLESAFASIARRDPMEALGQLSLVENYVGNTTSLVQKIVLEWSFKKPRAAADWVANSFTQDDPQRRTLLMQVLPRFARQDPNQAFKLALEQPTPSEGISLEQLVIGEIARVGNVEIAKKLLPQVKESAKASVYGIVGQAMVRESQAIEALELGNKLDEQQKKYYNIQIMSLWAATNPKNLYESLEDLPTSDLESRAALHLILVNRRQPVLSDDQIEHARTLLNSDDQANLDRIVQTN